MEAQERWARSRGIAQNCQKGENVVPCTIRTAKERSSYSALPCAKILSVAGFFAVSACFPYGPGLILSSFHNGQDGGFNTFGN